MLLLKKLAQHEKLDNVLILFGSITNIFEYCSFMHDVCGKWCTYNLLEEARIMPMSYIEEETKAKCCY